MDTTSWFTKGSIGLGLLASIVGLGAALYLIILFVLPYVELSPGRIAFASTVQAENAPITLFWSLVIVLGSLLVGYSVWRQWLLVQWMFTLAFVIFTILSLFSFGYVIAPATGLLLLSTILLTLGRATGRTPNNLSPM